MTTAIFLERVDHVSNVSTDVEIGPLKGNSMKITENATPLARVLVSSLREKDIDISLGEGLKIIAELTGHANWNRLRAQLKRTSLAGTGPKTHQDQRRVKAATDFAALFPEADLPGSFLDFEEEVPHLFPTALRKIPELAPWRECWGSRALSTRDRHFFPPMLPVESLISPKVTFEARRDWRMGKDGKSIPTKSYHFSDGCCTVLARNERHEIIGATFWRWWGNFGRVKGLRFGIYLLTKAGWLYVAFDLRANYPFPSAGPDIIRGDTEEHLREIKAGLERLAKLKVFKYAS